MKINNYFIVFLFTSMYLSACSMQDLTSLWPSDETDESIIITRIPEDINEPDIGDSSEFEVVEQVTEIDDNEVGTIVDFKNQEKSKLRLAEMGVMVGIEVRMIKKTPLGGPVQIKINNYYLTLRKEDASLIYLKVKS